MKDTEILKILHDVARRKNPFTTDDVCEFLGSPKYRRREYIMEKYGLSVRRINSLMEESENFVREERVGTRKGQWRCLTDDSAHNVQYYTDAEVLKMVEKTADEINPFTFRDLLRVNNFGTGSNIEQKLNEEYGLSRRRALGVMKKAGGYARFSEPNKHNCVKYMRVGTEEWHMQEWI